MSVKWPKSDADILALGAAYAAYEGTVTAQQQLKDVTLALVQTALTSAQTSATSAGGGEAARAVAAETLRQKYDTAKPQLDELIGEMFVQGVRTAQVGNLVEVLTGTHPSPSTVSRVFHTLEGEFESWKTRNLQAHYLYVFADGTYFTVIYDQEGCKMPILAVIGIDPEGQRQVLGFTVGAREKQPAWEDLLDNLKNRGVAQVDLWITDGNQAMINAIENKFPTAKRPRCVKHKMANVLSYIPDKQQAQVEPELNPASISLVEQRLNCIVRIAENYENQVSALPEFFHWCYTKKVLSFLLAARSNLNWREDSVDRTLITFLAIYLHGKLGEGFSNQMRQTKALEV